MPDFNFYRFDLHSIKEENEVAKKRRAGRTFKCIFSLKKHQLDVIVLLREPLQVNCVSQSHFEGINCIRINKQQYF